MNNTQSKTAKGLPPREILRVMPKVRLKMFARTVIITLAFISAFGGSGLLLDHYLGTYPKVMILGFAISFPITQAYLFLKARSYAQSHLPPKK